LRKPIVSIDASKLGSARLVVGDKFNALGFIAKSAGVPRVALKGHVCLEDIDPVHGAAVATKFPSLNPDSVEGQDNLRRIYEAGRARGNKRRLSLVEAGKRAGISFRFRNVKPKLPTS
jgi:hypothetical protein